MTYVKEASGNTLASLTIDSFMVTMTITSTFDFTTLVKFEYSFHGLLLKDAEDKSIRLYLTWMLLPST